VTRLQALGSSGAECEQCGVEGTVTRLQALGAKRLIFDSRLGQPISLFSLST